MNNEKLIKGSKIGISHIDYSPSPSLPPFIQLSLSFHPPLLLFNSGAMLSDIIPLFFHKDGCTNLLSVLFKVHHYDIITITTATLPLYISPRCVCFCV